MRSLFVLSLCLAPFCSTVQAATWVDAEGQSCDFACAQAALTAARSGAYVNGNPFFICSANAGGEGYRPGYNLQPSWSAVCVVGWGGKEVAVNRGYKCLCGP